MATRLQSMMNRPTTSTKLLNAPRYKIAPYSTIPLPSPLSLTISAPISRYNYIKQVPIQVQFTLTSSRNFSTKFQTPPPRSDLQFSPNSLALHRTIPLRQQFRTLSTSVPRFKPPPSTYRQAKGRINNRHVINNSNTPPHSRHTVTSSRRRLGYAHRLLTTRLADKNIRPSNEQAWDDKEFEWDMGSRFLRMPEDLRMELDGNGFFSKEIFDYLESSERKYADDYIGELMAVRALPFHKAGNYMDPFVHLKQRTVKDPDYPQFLDEFTARQANLAWTNSPVLFEKIIATRRKSLAHVDWDHQRETAKKAPFSALHPNFDMFGKLAFFPEPPNGPARPRRPMLRSPYPWVPPTDFDKVYFQL